MESRTIAVKLCFNDLSVTPEDVVRWAGGNLYRPDAQRKKLATDSLKRSSALVQPAFAFAAHSIKTPDIKKNFSLFFPDEKPGAGAAFMVAAVCTIGPDLENETSRFSAQGKYLDALFLDAAGVALVEALSDAAHAHLKKEAGKEGLFAGCRFGPGYENIPLNAQKFLFESLNSAVIGVLLKPSGVISPLKSSSFWTMWTSQPPEGNLDKCEECKMNSCAYRIAEPDNMGNFK